MSGNANSEEVNENTKLNENKNIVTKYKSTNEKIQLILANKN